jgi:cyanate permease
MPLVVLGVGVGFGAAAAGTLGAFLVSAFVDAGMGEGAAGGVAAAGSLFGLIVRLTAGARADRRRGGHLRVVASMMAAGAVAYGLLSTGTVSLMVLATPLAFGAGWGWPGLFNLAVVLANPASPGAATGITQTGTYIGALAGPLAFGAVADGASFRVAWLGSAACALLAAAAIVWGRRLVIAGRAPAIT